MMTGATIGPDEGIDGAGLLPAGAAGAGALAPDAGGAAPAGCWLLQPTINHPHTHSVHAGSRQRRGVVGGMGVRRAGRSARSPQQSARPRVVAATAAVDSADDLLEAAVDSSACRRKRRLTAIVNELIWPSGTSAASAHADCYRRSTMRLCLIHLAVLATASGLAQAQPRIVSPDHGEVVHDNGGRVQVVVVDAEPGAQLLPLLDGQPASEPVAAPAFELQGVERGAHQLVVELLDAAGRPTGRTAPVVFQVWQASRLRGQPIR